MKLAHRTTIDGYDEKVRGLMAAKAALRAAEEAAQAALGIDEVSPNDSGWEPGQRKDLKNVYMYQCELFSRCSIQEFGIVFE